MNSEEIINRNNQTTIRVLATIIIMFVHLPLTVNNNIINVIGQFGYVCVGIFYFFSGYNLVNTIKNKPVSSLLWSRFKRLYVPYVVANNLFFAYQFIGLKKTYATSDALYTILGIRISNTTLWYVVSIITFEVLLIIIVELLEHFKLLNKIRQDKNVLMSIFVISFLIYILVFPKVCSLTGVLYGKNERYPFCILVGAAINIWREKFNKIVAEKGLLMAVIFLILFLIFHINNMKGESLILAGFNLYNTLPPILITLLLIIILRAQSDISRPFKKLYTFSYEIYLLHFLFLNIYRCDVLYIKNTIIYILVYLISVICGAYFFNINNRFIIGLKCIDIKQKK